MGVISNGTTLLDAGALDSGVATGAMTLLSTVTASSSATVSFTSGINSTYKEYQVHYSDVHPATDNVNFLVNFRDGSSAFDATKTSSSFASYQNEAGNSTGLNYEGSFDSEQTTNAQPLNAGGGVGGDADESTSGILCLYDPSSTTFVKHFLSDTTFYNNSDYTIRSFIAGYCNTTAAIDGIQFSMSSGNIDAGTFKLYGIK